MTKVIIKNSIYCIVLFFVLVSLPLQADQVVFKNGRTLDCGIVAESTDQVEVSLGAGSMKIPKSQIERLIRSDSSGDAAKSSRSKGKIYSAQNAPEAYADLAADFRSLIKQRNDAMDARYMMNLHDSEIAKLLENIERLADEINGLNHQLTVNSEQIAAIKLPDTPPRSNRGIVAYNELIMQKQKLVDEGNVIYSRIGPLKEQYMEAVSKIIEIRSKYKTEVQPIMLYQKALQGFLNEYAERKKTILDHPDESAAELFETIDRFLDRFTHEMSTYKIDSEKVGDSTLVRALINGTTTGEFVFDTGATVMTISESFAKKLGIAVEYLPVTTMVVADGTVIEVKATRLKSVSVGDAEASNVDACVVADSPNTLEDGLLGMSFLKHFIVGINGTTGEIELTKLQAESSD